MCESLNSAIASVREMVQKAVESSVNLANYSRSLSAVASAVTTGVHRQASNLEETSAQLGEVTTLGESIASGGQQGQEAANQSREVADHGIEVVQTAIAGMQSVGNAAAEISQIVDAVDEISFKTNLLAVNASVEAAVAGEQGRGFRVVAEEIKTLSLRTDAAGKKIRKLIQDTNEAIAQGRQRVEASGRAFEDIVNCIRRLKAIMDEVASASNTQADSLGQLKQAVLAISEVVDKNSIGTDTINATASELAKEAQKMHGLVSAFKL
jgi:methyl-accepting chemotaxis protein